MVMVQSIVAGRTQEGISLVRIQLRMTVWLQEESALLGLEMYACCKHSSSCATVQISMSIISILHHIASIDTVETNEHLDIVFNSTTNMTCSKHHSLGRKSLYCH